jgi:hypothetical protein
MYMNAEEIEVILDRNSEWNESRGFGTLLLK